LIRGVESIYLNRKWKEKEKGKWEKGNMNMQTQEEHEGNTRGKMRGTQGER
jgi:hypothetical protein